MREKLRRGVVSPTEKHKVDHCVEGKAGHLWDLQHDIIVIEGRSSTMRSFMFAGMLCPDSYILRYVPFSRETRDL